MATTRDAVPERTGFKLRVRLLQRMAQPSTPRPQVLDRNSLFHAKACTDERCTYPECQRAKMAIKRMELHAQSGCTHQSCNVCAWHKSLTALPLATRMPDALRRLSGRDLELLCSYVGLKGYTKMSAERRITALVRNYFEKKLDAPDQSHCPYELLRDAADARNEYPQAADAGNRFKSAMRAIGTMRRVRFATRKALRRAAAPPPQPPPPPPPPSAPPLEGAELVTSLYRGLILALRARPAARYFREPVPWQALGLTNYPDVIKHPMDLLTVLRKLEARQYATPQLLRADVDLIWDNTILFNGSESWIKKYVDEMRSVASRKLDEVDRVFAVRASLAPPPPPPAAAATAAAAARPATGRGRGVEAGGHLDTHRVRSRGGDE